MTPFIETSTGVRFQPLAPIVATIDVEDIAHSLSNQCRFNGHTREFYSVAQHCYLVSKLLEEWGEDDDVQLWGLLHDASEAYLTDLPTPIKTAPESEGYRKAEKSLMRAICLRFGISSVEPERVRIADAVMLATEVRDLMPGKPEHWRDLMVRPSETRITPLWPSTAKTLFLKRFDDLNAKRAA